MRGEWIQIGGRKNAQKGYKGTGRQSSIPTGRREVAMGENI